MNGYGMGAGSGWLEIIVVLVLVGLVVAALLKYFQK